MQSACEQSTEIKSAENDHYMSNDVVFNHNSRWWFYMMIKCKIIKAQMY